jgi:hypothetical protein
MPLVPFPYTFFVQFYDADAFPAGQGPVYGIASIDPATVKNPGVQVWALPFAPLLGVGGFVAGRLEIQAQHSIEV